jgi:tetratricopeptide (TPR) repeat protein/transcriptional regulator with XRE-family HTH domain
VVLAMPGSGAAKRGSAAGGAARRARLAERRKALGLTQEALADLVGVERTTIVRWERGESAPLPPVRPKLARVLRVSAERLEELLASGAPAGPGPSGTEAGSRPRQLPPAVAGFTGRAAELAALTEILDEAGSAPGTVVISAIGGTAGVGKTALAITWAHQAADRFPDGQLYVNLRGYDPDRPMPPGDALAGFLRALGVAGQDIPPGEDERAARYRSLLAGKRVLVVLDNAGSSDQARPLLPGYPACTVLVTSRDALTGLAARDGAVRLDLDLLPLADAVRLLRDLIGDRAVADPDTTRTLAERCCRLPLALRIAAELAAAQPGTSLAGLASELADQQRLLDLLDADGDPRTAVRAVFSWSYRHLDAGTARAFRLLGLNPAADFDPYAVAALTGSDLAHARRTLNLLARAHLVQPTGAPGAPGPGRYAMHDLLRAYATELAAAHDGDGRHAALTGLLDHYQGTVAAAMDTAFPAGSKWSFHPDPSATPVPLPDAAAARAWLDGERPTLTTLIQYAAGHGWPAHAAWLSSRIGTYLLVGGHHPEAMLIFTSGRAAARQQGDRATEGLIVNSLAILDNQQGRYREALGRFLEARDLFAAARDRVWEARALSNAGGAYLDQGQYQQAIGLFEQAMSVWQETGDRIGELITGGNLGLLMARQGRYQQAAPLLRHYLDICRDIGDRAQECRILVALGETALRQGEHQQAGDFLRHALSLARADGYRMLEARTLTTMGELLRRLGRPGEATDHLRAALALSRELGDRSGEAETLNRLGEVHLDESQPREAHDQHAVALGLATENGDRLEEARAHDGLGNACHALGDTAGASRHWQAALARYTDMGVPEAARVRARLDRTRLRCFGAHITVVD